jgi:hypothetical protein
LAFRREICRLDQQRHPLLVEELSMNEPVIEIAGQRPELPSPLSERVPALGTWAQRWVTAAGQLADLNSRAVHTAIDEQRAIVEEAAHQPSWLDLWRLQAGYALAAATKSAAYLRHVSDITLGTYVDAVADAEKSVRETYLALLDSRAARATSLIVETAQETTQAAAGPILLAPGDAAPS